MRIRQLKFLFSIFLLFSVIGDASEWESLGETKKVKGIILDIILGKLNIVYNEYTLKL